MRITIPEGETRGQIARIAASEGLGGSYLAAARRSALLDPAHYGAPAGTPNLEGFLFPATYELYAGSPARRLVAEQLQAFEENFGPAEIRRARELHITPYQLLIVASMVEREALLERDRPRVAAVIYNRLRLGMALGIDATIRYALNDFSGPLTEAQLQTNSPYNTRTHVGLPPTPISNPGVAAIEAAAHPAHVPYLYYVNGADGCGDLVFSTSSAEFERNAAAYQEALNRNGGTNQRAGRSDQRAYQDAPACKAAADGEAHRREVTRLGVLGWPVAHSRSPAMHNAALRELGLAPQWSYQRLPVTPELFAETTRALGGAGFHGANVTIPHKQAALALATEASEAARAIGAANTLTFALRRDDCRGEHRRPGADRRDGARRALSPGPDRDGAGAGGTARAAVWALREAGAREVSVWNRTPERARELASGFGARVVPLPESTDILINCTSVGLVPPASASESDLNLLSLEHDLVGRYSYVVDFVYAQGSTELLALAREQGVPTLDGLELLVAQGALSLELWTGRPAPIDVMRRAAGEATAGR